MAVEDPSAVADHRFTVEARFYEPQPQKAVRCLLCPHLCMVTEGRRGHCGVRENRDGVFYSLVYGRICTAHVDPVEKKPFFHVLPGSTAFSIATAGCNVDCRFCQNAAISCARPEELPAEEITSSGITQLALHFGCASIACTYGEPTVSAEFIQDMTALARAQGIRSLIVSNGFIQPEAMKTAWKSVDAVKIDLKSFSERFYRDVVGARLSAVLDTLTTLRTLGHWTEIVCLLIPTLNDSEAEARKMARWIYSNLGADVPLHFTRFHPDHQMRDLPSTPIATLERARELAMAEGLRYVYIGNVPGHAAQNTFCPHCHQVVVERTGSAIRSHMRKNCCANCDETIAGVWH